MGTKFSVNGMTCAACSARVERIIGIPVAAGVLSSIGIVLTPMLAAAAMSLSSLCVIGNALRLKGVINNENKN